MLLKFFPKLVFVRFSSQNRLAVVSIPGVHSIIGFSGIPSAMDEQEFSDLVRIADAGVSVGPAPFPAVGPSCFLSTGPLEGIRGKLTSNGGEFGLGPPSKRHPAMFVVSLTTLRQSVAVSLAPDWNPRPISDLAAVAPPLQSQHSSSNR